MQSSQLEVAELFSPPRFTTALNDRERRGRAYDTKTGYNLLKRSDQVKVSQELDKLKPKLLVVCPPCTHESGWD